MKTSLLIEILLFPSLMILKFWQTKDGLCQPRSTSIVFTGNSSFHCQLLLELCRNLSTDYRYKDYEKKNIELLVASFTTALSYPFFNINLRCAKWLHITLTELNVPNLFNSWKVVISCFNFTHCYIGFCGVTIISTLLHLFLAEFFN